MENGFKEEITIDPSFVMISNVFKRSKSIKVSKQPISHVEYILGIRMYPLKKTQGKGNAVRSLENLGFLSLSLVHGASWL